MIKWLERVEWRKVVWLGLAVAGTLLIEIVINKYATYQYMEGWLSLIPILVFGALTIGNLIGLVPKLISWGERVWLFIAAGASMAAVAGLAGAPDWGVLWMALPFIAYGSLLSIIFGRVALPNIVFGLAIGGLSLYVFMGLLFDHVAPFFALVTVFLPLAAAIVLPGAKKIHVGVCLAIAAAAVGAQFSGAFEPVFIVERILGGFNQSNRVMKPIYTPLIRTDLILNDSGQNIIVTNGRRFAVVNSREKNLATISDPEKFIPSYDTPYLVSKPKKVLVIGSAEGSNIRAAIKHGATSITAVDINPAVFQIMKGRLDDAAGGIYTHPAVKTVVSEGRHFLETTNEKYDLITLQGVQTGSHDNLLNLVMLESYLLTRESLETLWNHLTPNGILWIEEYEVGLGKPGATLVSHMADTARTVLDIENFDQHYLLVRHIQSKGNPNAQARRWREGLILSRAPLGDSRSAVQSLITKPDVELKDLAGPLELDSSQIKNDNRPFFIRDSSVLQKGRIILGWLILMFLLGSLAYSLSHQTNNDRMLNLSQMFVGIGFILILMAVLGPLGLYLGDPQIATPVLFMSTYSFGLLGGVIALRARLEHLKWSLVGLVVYIVALQFTFETLKPFLIGLESTTLRVIIIVLLFAPVATFIELPYVWILNSFTGRSRAWSYTVENFGSLIGIPIGLWTQIHFGFSGTMYATALAFLIAYLVIPAAKGKPVFRSLKYALMATLAGLMPWYLSTIEASELKPPEGQIVQTSLECGVPKNKELSEIEVGLKNAEKLSRKGVLTVIVGPDEGCYRSGSRLQLFAIKRDKQTREITEKDSRFPVKIETIKRFPFSALAPVRQKYVKEKFGDSAEGMVFDELLIRKMGEDSSPD